MIDEQIMRMVDKAIMGTKPKREQLLALFDLDTFSPEAAYVKFGARQIARTASHAVAQVYAQIGLDNLPCPKDCGFCTLAESFGKNEPAPGQKMRMITNPDGTHAMVPVEEEGAQDLAQPAEQPRPAGKEVPLEEVVAYAKAFDEAGVHLISLMSTAAMPWDHYLEAVRAVRAAVHPDMPIMANTADLTLEQAQQLAEAGAQAAYHTVRLGEGADTGISPAEREATIRNIRQAGLSLMSCVEPVHKGSTPEELLSRMEATIAYKPFSSGVGVLTAVPGTRMENRQPVSRARAHYYACIMRLMAGTSIPYGVGGTNVKWADAGTNPRGRTLSESTSFLKLDVARLRKELAGEEWHVPDRPLASWFPFSEEAQRQLATAPAAYTPSTVNGKPRTAGGPAKPRTPGIQPKKR